MDGIRALNERHYERINLTRTAGTPAEGDAAIAACFAKFDREKEADMATAEIIDHILGRRLVHPTPHAIIHLQPNNIEMLRCMTASTAVYTEATKLLQEDGTCKITHFELQVRQHDIPTTHIDFALGTTLNSIRVAFPQLNTLALVIYANVLMPRPELQKHKRCGVTLLVYSLSRHYPRSCKQVWIRLASAEEEKATEEISMPSQTWDDHAAVRDVLWAIGKTFVELLM
ncbi:hypothetical protein LTR08_002433 [Meristemomyces frigidus]|nr:hypothetical protein LTR08_002433 [Meristemomyces frigidus]